MPVIEWPRLGLEATLSTCSALSVERQLLGSEIYGSYFGFGSLAATPPRDATGRFEPGSGRPHPPATCTRVSAVITGPLPLKRSSAR